MSTATATRNMIGTGRTFRTAAPRAQSHKAHVHELLVEYQKSHSAEVRDELVAAHLKLVRFIASRYIGRGEPLEDLCQVGLVRLVKTIERFDPQHGVQFSTYATSCIVGEIQRHFRDHGSALKVTRGIHNLRIAMARAAQEYTSRTGQSPTPQIIADQLNVTVDRVVEAQAATQSQHLLPLQREDGEDGDWLGTSDESLRLVDDKLTVKEAFRTLSSNERYIIFGRFYQHRTQSDIGHVMGVSQMQVSRMERAALQKMRTHLQAPLAAAC